MSDSMPFDVLQAPLVSEVRNRTNATAETMEGAQVCKNAISSTLGSCHTHCLAGIGKGASYDGGVHVRSSDDRVTKEPRT